LLILSKTVRRVEIGYATTAKGKAITTKLGLDFQKIFKEKVPQITNQVRG
jgi:hypothetical protein